MKSADNFRAVDDLRLLMGFNVGRSSPIRRRSTRSSEALLEAGSGRRRRLGPGERRQVQKAQAGPERRVDRPRHAQKAAEDNKGHQLLNLVLLQAIRTAASDIHFEPFEKEFKMRYRIDGVLYEMVPAPSTWARQSPAASGHGQPRHRRARLPQDGRIELTVGSTPIDLRVSVLPTMHGESVVMRVLDRSNVQLSLDRIGLRPDDRGSSTGSSANPTAS